jgi:hypothetical protein
MNVCACVQNTHIAEMIAAVRVADALLVRDLPPSNYVVPIDVREIRVVDACNRTEAAIVARFFKDYDVSTSTIVVSHSHDGRVVVVVQFVDVRGVNLSVFDVIFGDVDLKLFFATSREDVASVFGAIRTRARVASVELVECDLDAVLSVIADLDVDELEVHDLPPSYVAALPRRVRTLTLGLSAESNAEIDLDLTRLDRLESLSLCRVSNGRPLSVRLYPPASVRRLCVEPNGGPQVEIARLAASALRHVSGVPTAWWADVSSPNVVIAALATPVSGYFLRRLALRAPHLESIEIEYDASVDSDVFVDSMYAIAAARPNHVVLRAQRLRLDPARTALAIVATLATCDLHSLRVHGPCAVLPILDALCSVELDRIDVHHAVYVRHSTEHTSHRRLSLGRLFAVCSIDQTDVVTRLRDAFALRNSLETRSIELPVRVVPYGTDGL